MCWKIIFYQEQVQTSTQLWTLGSALFCIVPDTYNTCAAYSLQQVAILSDTLAEWAKLLWKLGIEFLKVIIRIIRQLRNVTIYT